LDAERTGTKDPNASCFSGRWLTAGDEGALVISNKDLKDELDETDNMDIVLALVGRALIEQDDVKVWILSTAYL